ncbi:glycosyltransferase [Marinobacter sp.]|uniref:glycosyltransferase n=1 Tax=Marinobacter sp. TaxID=50741 RepID=UPI0032977DB9
MTEGNSKLVVTHIVSGDLWAGAEVQVYNLCRALKASDQITPTAVVFNDGILHDKLKELGMPVSLADESKLGPWAIARSISAHCKEQESEIVHTHGPKENVLGILGKELARAPRSIRTVHGNPETRLSLKRPHKWFANRKRSFHDVLPPR